METGKRKKGQNCQGYWFASVRKKEIVGKRKRKWQMLRELDISQPKMNNLPVLFL